MFLPKFAQCKMLLESNLSPHVDWIDPVSLQLCRNLRRSGRRMQESIPAEHRMTPALQSAPPRRWKSVSVDRTPSGQALAVTTLRSVCVCLPLLHRWHRHRGHRSGGAGGGGGSSLYNSGDLLCLQARLLLQPKADDQQVRPPLVSAWLWPGFTRLSSCLCLPVTRFQLKETAWTTSGRRTRSVTWLTRFCHSRLFEQGLNKNSPERWPAAPARGLIHTAGSECAGTIGIWARPWSFPGLTKIGQCPRFTHWRSVFIKGGGMSFPEPP